MPHTLHTYMCLCTFKSESPPRSKALLQSAQRAEQLLRVGQLRGVAASPCDPTGQEPQSLLARVAAVHCQHGCDCHANDHLLTLAHRAVEVDLGQVRRELREVLTANARA